MTTKISNITPRDENGLPHGEWISYWENGVVKRVSNYNHGKIFGAVKGYDRDGHISHTSEYKEGVLDGVVEYYHHGNLISSAVFKNGTKQGREHVYLYKPDQTNNLQLVTFRSSFYIKNSVNQIIQDGELLDLTF